MEKKTVEQIYDELRKPFGYIGYLPINKPVKHVFSGKEMPAQEFTPYLEVDDVIKRLNEVLGVDGWQSVYEEMSNDKSMMCNLTCIIGGREVSKAGLGSNFKKSESADLDKIKQSDSLKRAAKMFGIGEFISEVSNIFLPVVNDGGKNIYLGYDLKTKLFTAKHVSEYINAMHPAITGFIQMLSAMSDEEKASVTAEIEAFKKVLIVKK